MNLKDNDVQVQGTNDMCTLSKCAMVEAGYMDDPYVKMFVDASSMNKTLPSWFIPPHKFYCIRVKAIRTVLHSWMESNLEDKQIISLGAGFDTSYFYLRQKYPNNNFKYVEVDFPHDIRRKMLLSRKSDLFGPHNLGFDCSKLDAPLEEALVEDDGKYMIVGFDLREVGDEFQQILTSNGIFLHKPTLFISEVSIVYMKPVYSDNLFKWLSSKFTNIMVCQLEPIRPHDGFGLLMMENFIKHGCPLETVYKYPTVQSQIRKFVDMCEHKHAVGSDLLHFYNKNYTNEEKVSMENKEIRLY